MFSTFLSIHIPWQALILVCSTIVLLFPEYHTNSILWGDGVCVVYGVTSQLCIFSACGTIYPNVNFTAYKLRFPLPYRSDNKGSCWNMWRCICILMIFWTIQFYNPTMSLLCSHVLICFISLCVNFYLVYHGELDLFSIIISTLYIIETLALSFEVNSLGCFLFLNVIFFKHSKIYKVISIDLLWILLFVSQGNISTYFYF